MSTKTLTLEGLPDDLDRIKAKLDLYFQNKRRSGGEILELKADPADTRRALLVYNDDAALQKVLSKKTHQIDFKEPFGVVELQVKLTEDVKAHIKKKPPVLPRPDKEKISQWKSSNNQPAGQKTLIPCQADSDGRHAEAETYTLLVIAEQAKDFLQMYFEQFISDPGLTKYGKNTWILKLSNKTDMEKVCAKKVHDYGISVSVYNVKSTEEQLDPRRFVLSGFDDSCISSFVSVYIGSCSQGAEHVWEALDDQDRIVVTFTQDIDVSHFLTKCSTKKFQDKDIGAHRLELTDSVLVQGDLSQITEEALNLYFSSKRSRGGDIKSLIWVSKTKSIIITFEECQVAQRVADHKHTLAGKELVAQLFYSSLQKALTRQTSFQPSITTDVVIPVSPELLRFIGLNEFHKQEFTSALKKVHASVCLVMDSEQPHIELKTSMDKQSLGMLRQGHSWERNTRTAAQNQLIKYMEDHIPVEGEVWQGIENSCLELNTGNACISFKSSVSEIVVAGMQAEVKTLAEKIKKMAEKASSDLHMKRDTIEKKINLDSKEELDLILHIVSKKQIDNMELSIDNESHTICLKGLKNTVNKVEEIIKKAQDNVVSRKLDVSLHLMKFFESLDLKKFQSDHFAQDNIKAALLLGEDSVQILADKADLKRAEDKFHEIIKDEVVEISGEQVKVTSGEQWEQFLAKLQKDLESSQNHKSISIVPSGEKIAVCGFSNVVADVLSKTRGYLENKKPVTISIPLKSIQELEFVESCMNLPESPNLKALGATVLLCKTQGSPSIDVTASSDKIKQATDAVSVLINAIITEKNTYRRAGEAKVLDKNQVMLMAQARLLDCNLQLSQPETSNHEQYSYDIEGRVKLTLGHGCICQQTADALICPLSSLSFDNPVAQQFLQFGGPEIKKVIDKFLKEKQGPMAGDVVVTNPGTLKCKHLIYAVIPVWGNSSSTLQSTYLQAAVHQSFVNAANNQCTSIGMIPLGCGTFGFPVQESCKAIITGIHSFIALGLTGLTNIYVLDSDAKVVAEFKSAIEGLGYNQSILPSPISAAPPSRGASLPLLPPKLASVNTVINRVSVTLKKGDITKETVDVIVNSNNQNLNLDTGVSGAILKAAGKSVEDECQKHGTQKADGVVFTGSGNLNSKYIAQMVGPNSASDISASIEKVLQLCESNMAATVAIPAIGTGRGGIDTKSSIKAILKGVENHTSQTPSSHLKKIFIVAFQDRIFESLRKVFNKRNRTQRSGQARTVPTKLSDLPPNQVKIQGVMIEVRKGDITYDVVKGIVNTTNANINLQGGVSGAILKAAGPAVEQECTNIRPLKGSEAAVTSGGALQCDFIIHMLGPHSVADASTRVTKVLQRCEEKTITTVSFPAVGTGGGGLTGTDSVGAILQGIDDHLSQCTSTVLKLIYIVVDQDRILQEFEQGLNQWKSNQQMLKDEEDDEDEDDTTTSEEDDSTDQTSTTEAMIGPVKVKLFCGDITKEKTDAIVSSTNTSLTLNTGVSGAILKAAGQTVVDECSALGTQPSDGVVITKPGNLPTKHIIHMVGRTKEADITSSMLKTLMMCESHKLQSVSFPALGTGAGNLGALQVGGAMIAAIQELLKTVKAPSLTSIHIVIFQSKMMKDFQVVMKKLKKVTPKAAAAKRLRKLHPKSHTFSTVHPKQPTLCLASTCRAVSFPAVEIVVTGRSTASLAQVKKMIDKLLSDECYSEDLISSQLSSLLEPEKQAIVDLSKKSQVSIEVVGKDKAIISGKKDDVLGTALKINSLLQKAKERETREGEERRLRETVRWEAGDGEDWEELDQSISLDLEHAFHDKKPSFSYKHQGETFTMDLRKMQRVDRNGTITHLKRTLKADSDTAVIQPPRTWTRMVNKDMEMIDLAPASGEYKKVEAGFILTSKNLALPTQQTVEVVKIQRIQNKYLWQRYAVKKQILDKKYPTNKNELNLYHGTTADICHKINSTGFNRSFCGRNATVYGNGTYFAKESWYSCQDTYSNPDVSGLKYMYRARVLVGKPCKGLQGMKEPSPLSASNPQAGLHDSAVDDLQKPFIYVVFCDAGAYPEYLISFKTK
ncbi:protein mono-ADP-ribosyltransferase PARP14 isoform X2 [Myripristis murdjan]|uniref:protein mono-ADP-ribosyltransferase PARP14 isoform X2 n=1 Tax=Myripristis murdjan TaxID=586833 RepID=UPI0011764677|nr:protein mono-ADP-ribosyltransferase PARP14-like isoform X2 [Myripristis murdjan]